MAKHIFQTKLEQQFTDKGINLSELEVANNSDMAAALDETARMATAVLRFLLDEIHEMQQMYNRRQLSESQMVMRQASLISDIHRALEPYPQCLDAVKITVRAQLVETSPDVRFAERFYSGIC